MVLHVFNPEHDLVLACNEKNYTAPPRIKEMRSALAYIPAFFAKPGDAVLAYDRDRTISDIKRFLPSDIDVRVVTKEEISSLMLDGVEPWGWDVAVTNMLYKYGVNENLLPSVKTLGDIRELSHRRNAIPLLHELKISLNDNACGCASECFSIDDATSKIYKWGSAVLKAPWSSSGVNTIFVNGEMDASVIGRCANIIKKQGCIMAEPLYKKVMDFAMEFYSDGDGGIDYLGLSIFNTENGSYCSNVVESETEKTAEINKYIPLNIISKTRETIQNYMSVTLRGRYTGPFGVDMMVVDYCGTLRIHPCVEVNLRRTMGHVAVRKFELLG